MRFGIHVPKQRNLTATADFAAEIGCETMQLFSGNPMSWTTGSLDARDVEGFRGSVSESGIEPVVLHTPYLINLASPVKRLASLSLRGLVAALFRSTELGVGPVIVHCGNHMGRGSDAGIERAVALLRRALERAPESATLALENGAGKGTEIGVSVEELSRLVSPFPRDRVGVVLDTAHLWALGHDLRERSALDSLIEAMEAGFGLERVLAIHGNDSSAELGSRRDRHALWSEGRMKRKGLRNIVGHPALSHLPLIFEIPGETKEFDMRRLASMKRLDARLRRARGLRGRR